MKKKLRRYPERTVASRPANRQADAGIRLRELPSDRGKEYSMRILALAGLVALATALGTTAAVPIPATAAPAAVRIAARPAGPPVADELFAVSCASSKKCLAVGQDKNAGDPLAEIWNGAAWKTVTVKLPLGTTQGLLGGVTCKSALCLAVGYYVKGGDRHVLADTWEASHWTPAQLPGAAGDGTGAGGVSCSSVKSCVVVGGYTGSHGALALADIWNGKKWTETKPPMPKGAILGELGSVSCVSAASCVAVGLYFTSTGGGALIDSWNGKTWSMMRGTVLPPGSRDGILTGVSCATAKSCLAVGYVTTAKGLASLAEMWNGKKWVLTSIPWPKGTTNPTLTRTSCPAVNRCVAVGIIDSTLSGDNNSGRAAAATWNGKVWATTPVAPPGKGKASLFNGVACLSAADCVAVGQAGPVNTTNGPGLSGFWNGKSWRLVTAK
jgi:hypothetical protein